MEQEFATMGDLEQLPDTQKRSGKKQEQLAKELDEILRAAGLDKWDLEKLSKGADAAKALAEAREVNFGLAWLPRWAKLLASWATALTLAIAFATLYVQSQQFARSEDRQRANEEDAHWRDAMKAVSFDNPSQALAAAIWMESFFDSQSVRHRELSRRVAASLLPRVENVAGFDNLLTDLVTHTDATNQKDIINIAQGISNFQWQRYGPAPEDPIARRSATREVIGGLEGRRKVRGREIDVAAFSAGTWEIDTASHALWQIWVEKGAASPRGMNLGDVVLENIGLEKPLSIDFTGTDFSNGVFSNASFHGAILTRAALYKVTVLDGVDFSGITDFAGSKWNDTDWWDAEIISPKLCEYLRVSFPAPKKARQPKGCL